MWIIQDLCLKLSTNCVQNFYKLNMLRTSISCSLFRNNYKSYGLCKRKDKCWSLYSLPYSKYIYRNTFYLSNRNYIKNFFCPYFTNSHGKSHGNLVQLSRSYHASRRKSWPFVLNNNLVNENLAMYATSTFDDISLSHIGVQKYIESLQQKFEESSDYKLRPLMVLLNQREEIRKEVTELAMMTEDKSTDAEMRQMAKDDLLQMDEQLQHIEKEIISLLVPAEDLDDPDIVLEISTGIGGQEAMLFAEELFSMYESYVNFMGCDWDITEYETTDIGGIRRASVNVAGQGAYRHLKYEGGIHRVQRVPKTEVRGRVHTSTASVAIIPQPSEIEINIAASDIKIETKRATGAGGQHVNTTDSAVRIVHLPTGIATECQEGRSQISNKKIAMAKLRAMLYQKQLDEETAKYSTSRKLQVGSRGRSEKIRTYNYPQDRVTDHRIGVSIHNLNGLLSGSDSLHSLTVQLIEEGKVERLRDIIYSYAEGQS